MYLLAFQEIISELFTQLNCNIPESTFATAELLEVVANTVPLFVSLACLCSEVGKEIDLLFVLVEEAELLVDERLHTNTAYRLRLVKHLLVEHPLLLVAWLGIEVNTEELSAAHLHRVGVADCRVVIQIE
jgi:hypothetical protein